MCRLKHGRLKHYRDIVLKMGKCKKIWSIQILDAEIDLYRKLNP